MFGGIDEFFKAHPGVGIVLASGLIFLPGHRYFARGDKKWSFVWMLVAIVMSFGFSIGALFSKMWLAS
jgi:hypothetical protein